MMKTILLFFFIMSSASVNQHKGDLINEISNQFRQGNGKEIAKYFPSTVNLSLMNNENVYSKVQAEIILSNFFKNNQPRTSEVLHRLDNNPNYQHAVILLTTSNGDYRIAYSLKGNEDPLQLIEIRIEKTLQ